MSFFSSFFFCINCSFSLVLFTKNFIFYLNNLRIRRFQITDVREELVIYTFHRYYFWYVYSHKYMFYLRSVCCNTFFSSQILLNMSIFVIINKHMFHPQSRFLHLLGKYQCVPVVKLSFLTVKFHKVSILLLTFSCLRDSLTYIKFQVKLKI